MKTLITFCVICVICGCPATFAQGTQQQGGVTQQGGAVVGVTVDVTAPGYSNIQISSTASSITATWDTNEPADTQMSRGTCTTGPYNIDTTLDVTLVQNGHTATFAGLNASTTYCFVLKSRDNSGNMTPSAEQSKATLAAGGCGPPTYPCGSRVTTTVAETNWSNTNPANGDIFTDTTYGTEQTQIADNTGWNTSSWAPGASPSMQANLWTIGLTPRLAMPVYNGSKLSWALYDCDTVALQCVIHPGTGSGSTWALPTSSSGFEMAGPNRFLNSVAPFASPDEADVYYSRDLSTNGRIIKKLAVAGSGGTFSNLLDPNIAACMNGNMITGFYSDIMVVGSGANRRWIVLGNYTGDVGTNQDQQPLILVNDATKGCRWWRTDIGTVTNAAGSGWDTGGFPTGTIPSAIRGKVHNMRVGTHPNLIYVTWATGNCSGITDCTSSIWDLETLTVYTVKKNPDAQNGGGHQVISYDYFVNNPNTTFAQFQVYSRPVNDPDTKTQRLNTGTPLVFGISNYMNSFNVTSSTGYFGLANYRSTNNAVSNGPFVNKFTMIKTSGTLDWSIQFNLGHSEAASFTYTAPRVYVSPDGKLAYRATTGALVGVVTSYRRGIVAKLH